MCEPRLRISVITIHHVTGLDAGDCVKAWERAWTVARHVTNDTTADHEAANRRNRVAIRHVTSSVAAEPTRGFR